MNATTTTTQLAPQPSLWSSLVEAVRGSHQDYTAGNLNRAILLLAVPMVLEMVLESLFAVVDVAWVGRLGADAVATVGLTESMLSLVFAVGLGLSLSTTAMVARRIGEKDPDGAAVSAVQAIILYSPLAWRIRTSKEAASSSVSGRPVSFSMRTAASSGWTRSTKGLPSTSSVA